MYSVLLVDDERIILEGLSVVVEWERHGTALAGKAKNGAEALEMIREIRPDIVITDLKMPNMNGLELIAAVREEYPDIVFVILSGYDEFEYAQRAMQYGVRHYLLKPAASRKSWTRSTGSWRSCAPPKSESGTRRASARSSRR